MMILNFMYILPLFCLPLLGVSGEDLGDEHVELGVPQLVEQGGVNETSLRRLQEPGDEITYVVGSPRVLLGQNSATVTTPDLAVAVAGINGVFSSLFVTVTASWLDIDVKIQGGMILSDRPSIVIKGEALGEVGIGQVDRTVWKYYFKLLPTPKRFIPTVPPTTNDDSLVVTGWVRHTDDLVPVGHFDAPQGGRINVLHQIVGSLSILNPANKHFSIKQKKCEKKHTPHFDCETLSQLGGTLKNPLQFQFPRVLPPTLDDGRFASFDFREFVEHKEKIPEGFSGGEPHFRTWYGEWFDFHGVCDLILLTSPEFGNGVGLKIHIRTKARYSYSFIESAAFQIGEDVLEIGSWGDYFLNGVEGALRPATLGGGMYKAVRQQDNERQSSFRIEHTQNPRDVIRVNTLKDWVSVHVENATHTNFATSAGLMGSFIDGRKLARDGVTAIEDDNNAFGQEWQVLDTEASLFVTSNRFPQYPHKCTFPEPKVANGRRLGQAEVSQSKAEKACENWKDEDKKRMCIFDVIASGDVDFAQALG